MDWLKDKPGLQWLLHTLSSVLLILLAFWLTGWSDGKHKVTDDILLLKQNKVSHEYFNIEAVKHQALESRQDRDIANKADKSLVLSMDLKLDLILEKL